MAQSREEKRKFYESLCDLQIPETIKFSPNAQHVLYSTSLTWGHKKGKHPVSTLWLAETGRPNSSRQITSGTYKDYSPSWSPNGKIIAFISDRAEAGKKWAIYVLNLRNGTAEGEAFPITAAENEQEIRAYEFSPDGTTIAYISADEKTVEQKARDESGEDWEVWGETWQYKRLRTVDLSTKQMKVLTSPNGLKLPERDIRQFAWSSDGSGIAVVSMNSPHIEEPYLTGSRISVLSSTTPNEIKDVCSFPMIPRNITWSGDGSLYFTAGTPDDKDCAGSQVYKVSPMVKVSTEKPSQNWEKVAFGVENDVQDLIKVAGDVIARVQHSMADCIYLVPDRLLYSKNQEIEAYDAAYTTNSDEIVLAVASSDVNHPVEVYTTTASGGSLVKLSSHGNVFKDQHFGTCNFLSCPSLDNEVQLDNVFMTPGRTPSAPPRPLPTVVWIHGGPTDRNTNRFNGYYYFWVPYLLRLGYGILMPNYRGSSGKGENFAIYSCHGQGKWDHEDVIAATQHAIEEGYIDKERIIVGGVSQGGFLSYLSSTRNGKHGFGWKYKASIPISGVVDTDAMGLTSDLGATLEMELNDGRAPWKMPKDNTQNRQASALWEFHEAMERSKKEGEMVIPPMLILHGEKDERCPLTQAIGMRRALMSAGLPFEMVTYPRQPHLIAERKHWVDMIERIERWCEKYIGPGKK